MWPLYLTPLYRGANPNALSVNNAHELAVLRTLLLELHVSVSLGEQRVVTTAADIDARVETSAALTNDDVAGNNFLAAVDFNAQAFTF